MNGRGMVVCMCVYVGCRQRGNEMADVCVCVRDLVCVCACLYVLVCKRVFILLAL
jgi:hypothetical protein